MTHALMTTILRPQIRPLTSLRFFAAMLVVLFHYGLSHPWLPNALGRFGYEAVVFFFILSGFVLTYAHVDVDPDRRFNISAAAFLRARMARILPAYALGLALTLPFFLRSFRQGEMNVTQFTTGLVLVPLLIQAWWPAAALAWNPPAWSLANELFFYTCFRALVRAIHRIPHPIIATFACIIAVDVMRSLLGTAQTHLFWAYFPILNLPQFALGIALAMAFAAGIKKRWANLLLASGIIATVAAIGTTPNVSWESQTGVLSIIFSALIVAAASADNWLSRALAWRPMVFLGDASYAIYILHAPLLLYWNHLTRNRLFPWFDFVLYITGVVCFSALTYVYFEKPLRRLIVSRPSRNSLKRIRISTVD
jgi:peptidoglycan/LPS O-acetylase OafA/YrhL